MTSKNQKLEQMLDFIIPILEVKHTVSVDPMQENIIYTLPKDVQGIKAIIALHEDKAPFSKKLIEQVNKAPGYSFNIFYKDGKNFMKSAASNLIRWKQDKTRNSPAELEQSTQQQLKAGYQLTPEEKEAIIQKEGKEYLFYYQPQTKILQEAIRLYQVKPVMLSRELLRGNGTTYTREAKSQKYNFLHEKNLAETNLIISTLFLEQNNQPYDR